MSGRLLDGTSEGEPFASSAAETEGMFHNYGVAFAWFCSTMILTVTIFLFRGWLVMSTETGLLPGWRPGGGKVQLAAEKG